MALDNNLTLDNTTIFIIQQGQTWHDNENILWRRCLSTCGLINKLLSGRGMSSRVTWPWESQIFLKDYPPHQPLTGSIVAHRYRTLAHLYFSAIKSSDQVSWSLIGPSFLCLRMHKFRSQSILSASSRTHYLLQFAFSTSKVKSVCLSRYQRLHYVFLWYTVDLK